METQNKLVDAQNQKIRSLNFFNRRLVRDLAPQIDAVINSQLAAAEVAIRLSESEKYQNDIFDSLPNKNFRQI